MLPSVHPICQQYAQQPAAEGLVSHVRGMLRCVCPPAEPLDSIVHPMQAP